MNDDGQTAAPLSPPRRRSRSRAWPRKGLVEGVSGLLFGLFVSALISLALALDVPLARKIERQGIDWSFRLALMLGAGGNLPTLPDGERRAARLVFLDLDEASCVRLAADPSACRHDRIGSADVLAKVGLALRDSGARMAVLDFPLPHRGGGASEAFAAWAEGRGPITIAALPIEAAGSETLHVDWSRTAGGAAMVGRLRYASAMLPGPSLRDGVIRSYPLMMAADSVDRNGAIRLATIPSLPFAAAMYLSHDRAAVDCALYAGPCRRRIAWHGTAFRSAHELSEGRARRFADRRRWDEPIVYTLPSMVPDEAGATPPFADSFIGNYEHESLRHYLNGSAIEIPRGHYSGAVVIIGSSATAADDWQRTPLWGMVGAEVIANAVRSFQAYPPEARPGGWAALAHKIGFVFAAGLLGTVACIAIAGLERRRRRRGRAARLRSAARPLLQLGIFVAAMLGALVLLVLEFATRLDLAGGRSTEVDILFPVLAVFLEMVVAGANWVRLRLQWLTEWLFAALTPAPSAP